MYKHASIFILISYLAFSCDSDSEINNFNDWSELNLKNQPYEIIEITSYSTTDLITLPDSLYEWFINEPIKDWFNYTKISFDSSGFIIKNEFHSQAVDTIEFGNIGKRIRTREFRNDSVIITSYNEKLPENCSKEIYILNENKFPIKKIDKIHGNVGLIDSFGRDEKNRIIEIYSKGNGIDDSFESNTILSLNEFGDPIQEITIGKTIMYNTMETVSYNDTVFYNYIYDKSNNWILKTISDNLNNINSIVQRIIKY